MYLVVKCYHVWLPINVYNAIINSYTVSFVHNNVNADEEWGLYYLFTNAHKKDDIKCYVIQLPPRSDSN